MYVFFSVGGNQDQEVVAIILRVLALTLPVMVFTYYCVAKLT